MITRADGLWAYQLAVTVDDGEAGVTHVVRGQDILGSTGRQVLLQRALGLPTPPYLHIPLALGDNGEKLSKQNGARSITGAEGHETPQPCEILDAGGPPAGDWSRRAHVIRERWLEEATRRWAPIRRRRLKRDGAARALRRELRAA